MHTLMRTCALGAAVLAATTNATANIAVGAFDPNTGLTWAYVTTLEEGTQSGYRAASGGDFMQLLSDGQFSPSGTGQSGSGELYLSEGGFYNKRYPAGQLGNSPVQVSESDDGPWRAMSALGMPLTAGTTGAALRSNANGSMDRGYVVGHLNGDPDSMGFVARYIDTPWYQCYGTGCPGGSFGTVGVVSSQIDVYRAAWGSSAAMISSVNQYIDGSSSNAALARVDANRIGYFMVKSTAAAVPEPATAWSFALGLALLGGLRLTRRAS